MSHEEDQTPAGANRLIANRYRLESSIGHGAMGTVWSGTDDVLQRQVAIKEIRLSPELPEEEAAERRERAVREARAMAMVTHPNVVMLYDVARENETPFVVMELVVSQSLSAILDRCGTLDQHQLALLADAVAAALEAAHRIGIVHRDVKPGNVLIGRHSEVKLSDFGISRNNADSTITHTGIVLGTPAFIAPEMAVGDPVTSTADLWSLGASLFTAAEGRLPYNNSTDPLITLSSIINGPVPQHRQTGPIGEVISGLMAKDPAQRMPLQDVRRRIQHLLPTTGEDPFDALLDPNAPTLRERSGTIASQPTPGSASRPPAPTTTPSVSPQPTTNGDPGTNSDRSWRTIALWSLGGLLLLVGAAGGFMISRVQRYDSPSGTSGQPMGEISAPGTMTRGIPGVHPAHSRIQAEAYSASSPGITTEQDQGGTGIGSIGNGDTVSYRNVDFGSTPAREFSARLAPLLGAHHKVTIEVRVDDPNSAHIPIGKLAVTPAGGLRNWKTIPVEITPAIGVHDVHLTFVADQPSDIVDLDWFQFHR